MHPVRRTLATVALASGLALAPAVVPTALTATANASSLCEAARSAAAAAWRNANNTDDPAARFRWMELHKVSMNEASAVC
jgi:hypothetical protein